VTKPKDVKPRCTGTAKRTGTRCSRPPVKGAKVCPSHGGGAPQVRKRALVRAELEDWGLGDATIDPGEVLLRLVSQSARRAEHYSQLLEQAYDAAERLKTVHDAEKLIVFDGDDEYAAATEETARADLKRIFDTGGVAALIGKTYGDSKTGGIYATGEQIRGLAALEAAERDRCAGFAAKAVAAGLAERTVRLAERQGELIAKVLMAVFEDLNLDDTQREAAPDVIRRHLELIAS
jgi:hypothetical protein